jgi:copper chaperone CopZ
MTTNGNERLFSSTSTVSGMSCGHCVSSVMEEVQALPGVRQVRVDLASGGLSVVSDRPIGPVALRDAVSEAGFTLVSSSEPLLSAQPA